MESSPATEKGENMWHIFLLISMIVMGTTIYYTIQAVRQKQNRVFAPINLMIIGSFAASVILFVPVYADYFEGSHKIVRVFETFFLSVHHTIRLFVIDSDFDVFMNLMDKMDAEIVPVYFCYAAVIFVLLPTLTFGFVLSFFKNLSAYRKYIFSYYKNVYIFSDLNARSIALAKSVKEKYHHARIIFTSVDEQDESADRQIEDAIALDAICFKKDILSINFRFHNRRRQMVFYMLAEDESENVRHGLYVISRYRERKNTSLYVFSNEVEGEVLFGAVDSGEIKVRRISEVRSLIYTTLEKTGHMLFDEAIEDADNPGKKRISALIVGVGKHGTEMIKALSWFGQMEGYHISMEGFDRNENAFTRFAAVCPELVDEEHNDQFTDDGESQYKIVIHPEVDVETQEFYQIVKQMPQITYVFIDVGTDKENIRTSIRLRALFEKMGVAPRIQAVVNDSERKRVLVDLKNHSGQKYNIDFIGDVADFYSIGSIIDSKLEAEALQRHLKWGQEADFWKYEYNYRSSLASALHKNMKIYCKIPGIDKEPANRTEEEKLVLRKMEHRRWNAYMRSEGYTYAPTRNNLAKTHHSLVTFDKLSKADQEKDDD